MADQNFRVKRGLEVGIGKTILYADPGGRIGIGTDNPGDKLHVSTASFGGALIERTAAGGGVKLDLKNGNGNVRNIVNDSSGILQLQYNSSNQVVVNQSGDVGIGTDNPSSKLHLTDGDLRVENTFGFGATFSNTSTTGMYITLADTGSSAGVGCDNGALTLRAGGNTNEKVRITSAGNVGINSTVPTAKLDVNGTLNVSGVSTFQSNVHLGDDDRLRFGDGNELDIRHRSNGDSSIVETGAGALYIGGNSIRIAEAYSTNYMANFTAGGSAELYHNFTKKFETTTTGITVSNGASTSATIAGPDEIIIDPATVGDNTGSVRIKGDLFVDGTQTIINSSTIELADFIVGIATTATTDSLADGAGIQIGPDNTFLYEYNGGTNPSLKSSENLNVASGKHYQIGETEVLNATTLGSGVVNSSLTSVGTLLGLTVSGDVSIADKIIHTGDTDTAIRFPADDTFTVETAGTEIIRVDSTGQTTFTGDVEIDDNSNSTNQKLAINSAPVSNNIFTLIQNANSNFGDDANVESFDIDLNYNGSTTFTANRTHYGFFIDLDHNQTGHSGTSGNRLNSYGARIDCDWNEGAQVSRVVQLDSTVDKKLDGGTNTQEGIYNLITYSNSFDAAGITVNQNIRGIHQDITFGSVNNSNVNIYGSDTAISITGTGINTITSVYGHYTNLSTNSDSTNYTITNSYGYYVLNDYDGISSYSNSYLFYGAYSNGAVSALTGQRRGIWIVDATHNHLEGKLAVGDLTIDSYDADADNLVIGEAVGGNAGLSIISGTTSTGNIYFGDGTGTTGEKIGRIVYDHNDNSLQLVTNSAERLRITSGGDVGIGTDNPDNTLHVQGGSIQVGKTEINGLETLIGENALQFNRDTSPSYIDQLGTGDIRFRYGVSNTTWMHMEGSNGNIGIGTDAPSQTLDVNGDVRFRGAIYDNNNVVGAANSILTSTGSGVVWSDITSIPVGDANTLDGLDSTQFLRSDVDDTASGQITFSDSIVPSVGNNTSSGINWPPNPGGGSGDQASIRYYITSGENTTLEISNNNDASDIINFVAGSVNVGGNRILTTADEGSGNGLDADTLDGLDSTQFLRSDADDITTGQIQSTKANSTTTGGGQIYLNGATGNRIDWNTNGVAAPAFTTRSAGTKLVLYPQVGASNVDYALGINVGNLWYSVPNTSNTHRWYGGTTSMMSLTNSNLDVVGTITGSRLISDVSTGTAPLTVSSTTLVSNLNVDQVDGLDASQFLRSDASDTTTGDITISKTSPKLILSDTNTTTGSYPAIQFDTNNNQGVLLEHNEFNGELPTDPSDGYGLILKESPNNGQFPSTGTLTFTVLGEIYTGSATTASTSRVLTTADEGSGNGLDADTVDGIEAENFLRSDIADTASGVITFSDDVSIADKIVHTGDTNTAIRFPAADTFTVETSGSERLRINASGDVGIGTNAPNSKLHIKGSSALSNIGQTVLIQDDLNDDSVDLGGTLGLTGIVNGTHRTLGVIKAGKEDAGTSFNGYLGFFTRVNGVGDAQERIRITSAGNVGIGTDIPATVLDVKTSLGRIRFNSTGSLGSRIQFTDADGTLRGEIQNNGGSNELMQIIAPEQVRFSTASTERLRITDAGNVGINTIAPSQKLDVNGNARFRGAIYDSGNGAGTSGQVLSSTGTGIDWIDQSSLNVDTATTATTSTNVTVADESTDTTCFPLFVTAATGDLPPKSGTNLKFNSASGILDASQFKSTLSVGSAGAGTSLTEGAIVLNHTAGAIVIDSSGQRRISWNDGGGNFQIRSGHYYNSGEKYVVTGDSAANIQMNTDAQTAQMLFEVANTGTAGNAVTWNKYVELTPTSFNVGGNEVLDAATSFSGDVSGTYNAIVVADDSHNHAFDNLTSKTSGTGDYTTTGTFTGNTLVSTVTTGTAPLTVTSTTLVSNLNADLLDGQEGSYYLNTATSFSGDVTGTYNSISVTNDSHTHDTRYFTETESDARFLRKDVADTKVGVTTFTDNVDLGDADRLRLGDGQDLQIYHTGSISRIEDSSNKLEINSQLVELRNAAANEVMLAAYENDRVELYYDSSKKLETTGFGVTVTGIVSATSYYGDGSNLTGIQTGRWIDAGVGIITTTSIGVNTTTVVGTANSEGAIQAVGNIALTDGAILTDQNIDNNIYIPSGKNGLLIGPSTVGVGVTIDIAPGSTLVVV